MRWECYETIKKHEYPWGSNNIKRDEFINMLKENTMTQSYKNYVNAMAKYGAQAEIKLGNATFPVRINTVNQTLDEVSFKCTALSSYTTSKTPSISKPTSSKLIPAIKDVIFNDPATIILWSDNTKTVVKCGEWDIYDPEMGMAMAIAKKALGNEGNYYEYFKKWLKNYTPKDSVRPYSVETGDFLKFLLGIADGESKTEEPASEKKPKWIIFCSYNGHDEYVYDYKYSSKYSAQRAAWRMFGGPDIGDVRWHVEEV